MPPVRPDTILSLRACTAAMSIDTAAPSMPVSPHSFAACATLSACACSSSAFVGMQPQMRQVPPSAFWRSTTATFNPSCAARMAATYPPVPAPITTTSYSFAIPQTLYRSGQAGLKTRLSSAKLNPSMSLGTERARQGSAGLFMDDRGTKVCWDGRGDGRRRIDLGLELAVIELELPVHLGDLRQLPGRPPRVRERHHGNQQRRERENPQSYVVHLRHFQL